MPHHQVHIPATLPACSSWKRHAIHSSDPLPCCRLTTYIPYAEAQHTGCHTQQALTVISTCKQHIHDCSTCHMHACPTPAQRSKLQHWKQVMMCLCYATGTLAASMQEQHIKLQAAALGAHDVCLLLCNWSTCWDACTHAAQTLRHKPREPS